MTSKTPETTADFKIPLWVFLLIGAVYFSAIRVDVMDVDAAQYAEMSREMMHSHNWLQLFDRGQDYLDKPPFLFWVTALSMKVFGATNFGYKLPSILFAFLAIFSTYRLAKILYNESLARISALVLASCQGLFLWTNDVRTDTMLMSCVITAIWCIRECEEKRRWYFVLGATLAIACGMMTKGPVALFVPLFAFGADWVFRRKWKLLFSPWHLLDAAIIAVFLIPMCIGLYLQFDLHPEKIIDGQTSVSGLKFFFWTQSFGRITGDNAWANGADPFFLLSSMLWAFLPWILLFLTAIFLNVKQLFQQRFRLHEGQEWVSSGGFLLSYLSLCFSQYQLPHYILVAFPLAAIVTGKFLYDMVVAGKFHSLSCAFAPIQSIISFLLLVGALLIVTFVFPAGIWGIVLWLAAFGVWLFVFFQKNNSGRIIWISAATMVLINLFLTNGFYYNLLQYQGGSVVGKFIRKENINPEKVVVWLVPDAMVSLHFYARGVIPEIESYPPPGKPGQYIITTPSRLSAYDSAKQPYHVLLSGRLFKVTEVTPQFLNPKTRDSATTAYCLVRLQ